MQHPALRDKPLEEILLADERVTSKIDAKVIKETLDPMNYIDSSPEFVDRAVEKWGK